MKPKTVVLLAVAVGSGLLAMLGVQQAMSGSKGNKEETLSVLVSVQEIEVGVRLTEENVEFRELPVSVLPEDPVTSFEQYEKRAANYPFKSDDIIRVSRLTEKNGGGKSYQIPKGMRVVSIPVNDTHTVSGLLQPGDRVDLLVTYSHRDRSGMSVTKTMTLLEYVEIFSTDDRTAKEVVDHGGDARGKARNVSLLLTPEQVPYVKLAEAKGTLALSWRHRSDDVIMSVGSINEELLDELEGVVPGGWGSERMFEGGPNSFDPEFAGAYPWREPVKQNPPQQTPPEKDLNGFLAQSEGTPPATAETQPEPPKNMWSMQIYVGNDKTTEEFELPEPPQPAEETSVDEGGGLWKLFKRAI